MTRARRKNIVVCSFDPVELDVAGSAYDGPKHLKEFLAYVKAGGALADAERAGAVRDRHRDDVAAALRNAGLHVRADVGMSKFKVDLVLSRPEDPDVPVLPVLLDGESWSRRDTVSDRDVLPVEVLTGLMGWPAVLRIWWPMWLQNRDAAVRRVWEEVDRLAPVREPAGPAVTTEPPGVQQPPAPGAAEGVAPRQDDTTLRRETAARSGGVDAQGAQGDDHPVREDAAVDHDRNDLEFVAAHTTVAGPRSVLDALPSREAADVVREQLMDVVDTEGPVEVARLVRLVARRFDLSSVRAGRAEQIRALIPRQTVRRSSLGVFVWPAGIDAGDWTGFRIRGGTESSRALPEIAPEEIGNAMRAVTDEFPDLDDDAVLRMTAELLLGITRLGASARARLEAVREDFLSDRPTWDG